MGDREANIDLHFKENNFFNLHGPFSAWHKKLQRVFNLWAV